MSKLLGNFDGAEQCSGSGFSSPGRLQHLGAVALPLAAKVVVVAVLIATSATAITVVFAIMVTVVVTVVLFVIVPAAAVTAAITISSFTLILFFCSFVSQIAHVLTERTRTYLALHGSAWSCPRASGSRPWSRLEVR